MNAAGQVAFFGSVKLPSQQYAVSGIWAQDRSGVLQLIVRGDQSALSQIDPPLSARLDGIDFGKSTGGQDGSASSFNDRGEILFRASGRIYVSSRVAVPEPSSAALILIGLLSLGGRRVVGRRALRL